MKLKPKGAPASKRIRKHAVFFGPQHTPSRMKKTMFVKTKIRSPNRPGIKVKIKMPTNKNFEIKKIKRNERCRSRCCVCMLSMSRGDG